MNLRHFVLVCDELPERREPCLAHLEERGVRATAWSAFHARSWGLQTIKEYDPGKRLPPGHVGLNCSAWALYQHMHLTSHVFDDAFVVFEDDVTLPKNYWAEIDTLFGELDAAIPDWQLVFLGLSENAPHVWHKVTERVGKGDSRLCRLTDPFGTHAILMRPSALPVLLQHMRLAERNLDQQLWKYVLQPNLLKWCAVLPSIVTQRTFDYTGTGKPEWAPSTIHESDPPDRVTVRDGVFIPTPDGDAPTIAIPHHHGDVKALVNGTRIDDPIRVAGVLDVATASYVDPLPCLFRSEWTDQIGVMQPDPRGIRGTRTVPLAVCARLNELCFARPGRVLQDPKKARSCGECNLRIAMPRHEVRPRLDLPEGHFNPSMVMYQGKLILATRDNWGHSKVGLWQLENTEDDWTGEWSCIPVSSLATDHPDAPRLEDPRLFVHQGKLHSSFSLPDGYPPKLVQVGYVRFSEDLQSIEDTVVFKSPNGNAYEKNWVYVGSGDEIRWVYASKPEHVVMGPNHQKWATPNNLPWTGGVVRGGATPVLMNGVYYHFFHGCLKRLQGSVYTMGCIVFEAKPPYRVLRQTIVPLAWPDEPAPGEELIKRYVCWPGGAVPHAGAWHVCLGVDDTYCRIINLPFEDVEGALNDVPQIDDYVSIRDTILSHGAKAS